MNEIVSFIKEMFMIGASEKMPVGLCAFENTHKTRRPVIKHQKKKHEMRLSELMDK